MPEKGLNINTVLKEILDLKSEVYGMKITLKEHLKDIQEDINMF